MCTFSLHICDLLCLHELGLLCLSPSQNHTHTGTQTQICRHTLLSAVCVAHTHICTCTLPSSTSKLCLPLPHSTTLWFQLEPVTYESRGLRFSSRAIFQIQQQQAGSQAVLFLPGIKHDAYLLMKLDLEVKFIICHVLGFNFQFM